MKRSWAFKKSKAVKALDDIDQPKQMVIIPVSNQNANVVDWAGFEPATS